eukprot:jgi/Ulvmu1/3374/UM156_0031.1
MKARSVRLAQHRIRVCPANSVHLRPLGRRRNTRKAKTAHALLSHPVLNDAAITAGILTTATALMYSMQFFTTRSMIDRAHPVATSCIGRFKFRNRPVLTHGHESMQKDTRKLVHILCGPILLLFWPLYSATSSATPFATLIPCAAATALLITGTGIMNFQALTAVSRGGEQNELLRGPLIYCVILTVVTVMQWQATLPGICAIAIMCGGDGFADIVGRRFGNSRLPWNKGKSAEGSAAMFTFGSALSMGLVAYFHAQGMMATSAVQAFPLIACTSLVCTGVESVPPTYVDDNISVPVVAAAVAYALHRAANFV